MKISDHRNQLAIVIPAYKGLFLRHTLESIARQTDKRFTVYVGDDASPDNIKQICDDFTDRFDLVYTRFNENLGHKSLVAQWNRCIELSSEPWIWLFCDDDVMEPVCVEMFYKTLEAAEDKYTVLRFNTLTINDEGEVTRVNPPHPLKEKGIHFIYHRLRDERLSYVSEYIFARQAYIENSGMVDFPIAWCSDDASWLTFTGDKEILTIQDAKVLWRRGAYNITPSAEKHQTFRIEASYEFVKWLDDFSEKNVDSNEGLKDLLLKENARNWFLRQIRNVAPVRLANYPKFSFFIRELTRKGPVFAHLYLLKINAEVYLSRIKRTGLF